MENKVENIKEKLKSLFNMYNIKKAILYGSVAKGIDRENSDIDIIVDGDIHGLHFYGLLEKMTKILNREVDLIEQSQVIVDSKLDNEIKKYGVIIHG